MVYLEQLLKLFTDFDRRLIIALAANLTIADRISNSVDMVRLLLSCSLILVYTYGIAVLRIVI